MYSAVWIVYTKTEDHLHLQALGWVRAGNEEAALRLARLKFDSEVTVEETEGEYGWIT